MARAPSPSAPVLEPHFDNLEPGTGLVPYSQAPVQWLRIVLDRPIETATETGKWFYKMYAEIILRERSQ